jgi:hypothetical protein
LGGATAATTLSAGLNQISEGPPRRRTARNGNRRTRIAANLAGREGSHSPEGRDGLEGREDLENFEGLAWAPGMEKD